MVHGGPALAQLAGPTLRSTAGRNACPTSPDQPPRLRRTAVPDVVLGIDILGEERRQLPGQLALLLGLLWLAVEVKSFAVIGGMGAPQRADDTLSRLPHILTLALGDKSDKSTGMPSCLSGRIWHANCESPGSTPRAHGAVSSFYILERSKMA